VINRIRSLLVTAAFCMLGASFVSAQTGDLEERASTVDDAELQYSSAGVSSFDFIIRNTGGGLLGVDTIRLDLSGTALSVPGLADAIDWSGAQLGVVDTPLTGVYDSATETVTFDTTAGPDIALAGIGIFSIAARFNPDFNSGHGSSLTMSVTAANIIASGLIGEPVGPVSHTFTVNDNVAPVITSVTVPSDGIYSAGDSLEFVVTYDENVLIPPSPSHFLRLGVGGPVAAVFDRASAPNVHHFVYTVADGQAAINGISVVVIQDPGSDVQDAAGNVASPILAGVASTVGVRVDAVAPSVDVNDGAAVSVAELDAIIQPTSLRASDNFDSPGLEEYRLIAGPTSGVLNLFGVPLGVGDNFSQANINDGLLTYTHTGMGAGSDAFEFVVLDAQGNLNDNGGANHQFNITISAASTGGAHQVPVNSPFLLLLMMLGLGWFAQKRIRSKA